ncbi:MAG: hypothetical protein JWR80_4804 [Bradyrhizobium sp.]|nr:hypothetical protein [Bradyrhizobium sp.]
MSAVNIIVQSDAVHLLTDGACYNDDGTMIAIGPKVTAIPHLSCAVAFRGPQSARPILSELIGISAPTFDTMRASVADLLRRAAEAYAPLFEQCSQGADFEAIVAGISETDGPYAFIVPSHSRFGTEPFVVVPIGGLTCTPNNDAILAEIVAALPADCAADDIDPQTHGLAVMEIQRAHLIDNNGIDGHFAAVGGFAQLTTVTSEAVVTRILHRWPDRPVAVSSLNGVEKP